MTSKRLPVANFRDAGLSANVLETGAVVPPQTTAAGLAVHASGTDVAPRVTDENGRRSQLKGADYRVPPQRPGIQRVAPPPGWGSQKP